MPATSVIIPYPPRISMETNRIQALEVKNSKFYFGWDLLDTDET